MVTVTCKIGSYATFTAVETPVRTQGIKDIKIDKYDKKRGMGEKDIHLDI